MDKAYWLEKWDKLDIGFHQTKPHALLIKHFHDLALPKNSRVFVPLCGASIDMFWLIEQGYTVIGAELSMSACETFFETHQLAYTTQKQSGFIIFSNPKITLLCGDFFKLPKDMLGTIDAVYDRAALVALPQKQRFLYVRHLLELTNRATQYFIISIIYDIHEMEGPPFAVSDIEIYQLYRKRHLLSKVSSVEIKKIAPHLRDKGLLKVYEELYRTL